MISSTNLTRSGIVDWLVQRISAIILLVYTIYFVYTILSGHIQSYWDWIEWFENLGNKIFTFVAILAFVAHAWIGLWTVATDYIKPMPLRLLFHVCVAIFLIVACFVSLNILLL